MEMCNDCPPVGYPTDKTRCLECPRRSGVRRFVLLWGWARFLSRIDELRRQQENIKDNRPGRNWAILVHDDPWALIYQRIEFRIDRARHAVREYGMSGCTVINAEGYHRYTDEELHKRNCESLQKIRLRAHEAKRKLDAMGSDNEMDRQARAAEQASLDAERY